MLGFSGSKRPEPLVAGVSFAQVPARRSPVFPYPEVEVIVAVVVVTAVRENDHYRQYDRRDRNHDVNQQHGRRSHQSDYDFLGPGEVDHSPGLPGLVSKDGIFLN